MGDRKQKKIDRLLTIEEPTDNLNSLPTEILFKILEDFSIADLFAVRAVGPRLYDVAGAVVRQRQQRTLMYYDRTLPANIDNTMLEWMVSNMPLLHTINLGRVTPQTQQLDLDILAKHCSRLKKIDFLRFRFDRDDLARLLSKCPKLWMSQSGVRYRLYGYPGVPADPDDARAEARRKVVFVPTQLPSRYRRPSSITNIHQYLKEYNEEVARLYESLRRCGSV